MAPPPLIQKLNAALHIEPIKSLFFCFFWSFFLLFWTPVALLTLQVIALWNLAAWFAGWTGDNDYDPSTTELDMAVVITGCDSGFGKETALWAADAGYHVFAGCLVPSSCDELDSVPGITALRMDVTVDNDVEKMVSAVKKWLEETTTNEKPRVLHALINNAGIGPIGDIDWLDMADFTKTMDVNYFGMVRCCKEFLPILKEQAVNKRQYQGCRVLNVVSTAGLVAGGIGMASYQASKFAAQAFTECLRDELKVFGIQVGSINPSFHGTPLVKGIDDKLNQLWESLPSKKRDEYGEEYKEQFHKQGSQLTENLCWKVDVVVDQMVRCLRCGYIPRRLVIGSDARFIFVAMRMVPGWVVDFAVRLGGRPMPAMMKKHK